ncbi:23S rRNA (pseudouridine(1915)-N(3))-methyltransferase RlmH [Aliidiomarina halalkaliphila]|uniref:Ribosomal RNA large subunit methyltransferase H n=1 Tax=Aliidiomarina halalkaliphila TaxID=2593535 RepID=A0A552X360_9GAMM|nr:23S rRNA (pseudouridine(1915)-N(3))-methyltransferase RlmH [Aliidiomarina halalkaliphila]TRW49415.1 23S rRNA (pseudouridine(1915)-N(3))-methyltransferase RlmH [Aliidiomarina halalkaliphila]
MRLQLIAVGNKMPGWILEGYHEYAKRMPPELPLDLIEIVPGKRSKKADVQRLMVQEGEKVLAAIKPGTHVVALEVKGKPWDTHTLAKRMQQWQLNGQDVAFIVGGPEGLSADCKARANEMWSLSPLTLPHPMVRVIIAEALFRAWSLLNNHPYHRE